MIRDVNEVACRSGCRADAAGADDEFVRRSRRDGSAACGRGRPARSAVRSRVDTPEYSRMRTSGNVTAALNVTVTVGLEAGPPPVMLLA